MNKNMLVVATNPWGRPSVDSSLTLEPQRADLWVVDLGQVLNGVTGAGIYSGIGNMVCDSGLTVRDHVRSISPFGNKSTTINYYVASVALPEQVIKPEEVVRESRPYNVPGYDGPLGPTRMTFIHDISAWNNDTVRRSEIWSLLTLWRMLVRAGRGGFSSEVVPLLDANFKANYAFPVNIKFLGGLSLKDAQALANNPSASFSAASGMNSNSALEISAVYTLENCWLSTMQIGEINYEGGAKVVPITATFYADSITPWFQLSAE
jgi:hypothetical protein